MSTAKLQMLLLNWLGRVQRRSHMVRHESSAEHLFRYLEEVYGCGNLACHVAHGAIMAMDEHVVSCYPTSEILAKHGAPSIEFVQPDMHAVRILK